MTIMDKTKPFYHEEEGEDVKGFLLDYDAYATSKDWNDDCKRQVLGLFVDDHLRLWIRSLIKSKTTWADLKKGIIDTTSATYNIDKKIKRLMNIKQIKNESGAFKEKVEEKYTETFNKVKEGLQIEMYNKNIEYDVKKATKILLQKTPQSNKEDAKMTQLTEVFENLKLRHVMNSSSNEIEEVKNIVNKLIKTVNDVTRRLKSQRKSESRKCFMYQEVGHILRNCPNKQRRRGKLSKGKGAEQTVEKTDVQFSEYVNNQENRPARKIIEEKGSTAKNCLKIEV
ncbi:14671_t:CDS:2, partial [Racocetra fulgida]